MDTLLQSRKTQTQVDKDHRAAIEALGAAIKQALAKAPVSDVLSILTGAFVGLTLEVVRRAGQDASKEVKIDGGAQRDITIHAPKEPSPGELSA